MTELIAKISRGTHMDQIYLSKNRAPGLETGSYVLIEPIQRKKAMSLYWYKVKKIEPIKIPVVEKIFGYLAEAKNVIITGSFLEKGFRFNDIDVIIIDGNKGEVEQVIHDEFGLRAHVIRLTSAALRKGMNTDPLFQLMLSKFIAKKRIFFRTQNEYNYKLLDLHLLKSKGLMDNFDDLGGSEKYKLVRNLFAIRRFLDKKPISKESVEKDIEHALGKDSALELLENRVKKEHISSTWEKVYRETFEKIMEGIQHGAEQE
ncbi:MAG: hypothetical protein V1743_00955 [Nanoarchaeota archaeon]